MHCGMVVCGSAGPRTLTKSRTWAKPLEYLVMSGCGGVARGESRPRVSRVANSGGNEPKSSLKLVETEELTVQHHLYPEGYGLAVVRM